MTISEAITAVLTASHIDDQNFRWFLRFDDPEVVAMRAALVQLADAVRDDNCYEIAGSIFGHLRESLGFGELVMTTQSWGQHATPSSFVYQWSFTAKGKTYRCHRIISLRELHHVRSMKAFADHISDEWKNEHRKVDTSR